MNAAMKDTQVPAKPVAVHHFIKGRLVRGAHHEFGTSRRFTTPQLNLDELVWSRLEPGPAFDVPLAEILDLLVATGAAVARDKEGLVAEAIEQLVLTGPLDRRIARSLRAIRLPGGDGSVCRTSRGL